jgi:uncharacterized protein (DUF1501 family)
MTSLNASRREFLKRSSALSVLGVSAPFALNLAAMGSAAAQTTPSDYKALVCVYFAGGNDNFNTLIPSDANSYSAYTSLRGALALPTSGILPLSPLSALPGGRQFALPQSLSPFETLFNNRKLAVMLNLGTLIEPITKAEYIAKSKRLPPKIGSHNDQTSIWQASQPEGARSGWGGMMGDVFAASNQYRTFTNVSVAGASTLLSGQVAPQYQLASSGPVKLAARVRAPFGSSAVATTLEELIKEQRTNLFEKEHTVITKRAIDAEVALSDALAVAPALSTTFPTTNLGNQLKMVARMIQARSTLNNKRQVFFVQIGGFDLHDGLLAKHGLLQAEVAGAMSAFYDATVEMSIADKVTSFTASEFGRTITSNGDGSDHGWGSFHFVLGGAVQGKRFFGTAPEIANNGANDTGSGRLIPSIAVDQYAATLGKWFGVPDSHLLSTVLPNLSNYDVSARNLEFMSI